MLRILTANIHFSVTFNLCNHLQLYTPGRCELAVFSIPSHTLILWKSDIPEQNWILCEQLKECANKRQTTSHTTSSLVILPIAFVELGWFPHSLRKWRIKERTTTSYQLRFVWITLHRITRKYIYIERERERKRKREREKSSCWWQRLWYLLNAMEFYPFSHDTPRDDCLQDWRGLKSIVLKSTPYIQTISKLAVSSSSFARENALLSLAPPATATAKDPKEGSNVPIAGAPWTDVSPQSCTCPSSAVRSQSGVEPLEASLVWSAYWDRL